MEIRILGEVTDRRGGNDSWGKEGGEEETKGKGVGQEGKGRER